ncbi:MAG: response regulator [Proteobacteria bacterium]|nr:response regulator [Pseudomonadota bacterium]MBU6425027.1 response regulator [Rhodospirillales bacterium]
MAADGRAGLLTAAPYNFEVLIIDRLLPGLDGRAALQTLLGAGISTPALFLTAHGGLDDQPESLPAEGDDYMVKPYAISSITVVILFFDVPLLRRLGVPSATATM